MYDICGIRCWTKELFFSYRCILSHLLVSHLNPINTDGRFSQQDWPSCSSKSSGIHNQPLLTYLILLFMQSSLKCTCSQKRCKHWNNPQTLTAVWCPDAPHECWACVWVWLYHNHRGQYMDIKKMKKQYEKAKKRSLWHLWWFDDCKFVLAYCMCH